MGLRRLRTPRTLSNAFVSNALEIPPLPLQQRVTDERDLLTVPWTLLLQGMEQTIAAPTYLEGTHADRIDPDADAANFRLGAYFYETDRNVLYQSRLVPLIDPAHPTDPPISTPCWVYVGGTMNAPLASRPADLGKPGWTNHHNDTGFRFHAADTGQDYLWNGTAWVDITTYAYAVYGMHAGRLAHSLATLADGTLWCEIDRGNALYQLQGGIWWYVAGTMFGTLIPDERPTDLGVHDGGFDFRTSVPPQRQFLWSQTAWVEILAAPPVQDAPVALPLQSGWGNFGSGWQDASYLRDSNGWVHLRGMISGGTFTGGTVLGTLPAGCWPVKTESFAAYYASGLARIDVYAGGLVALGGSLTSNGYLSLSGISFSTL